MVVYVGNDTIANVHHFEFGRHVLTSESFPSRLELASYPFLHDFGSVCSPKVKNLSLEVSIQEYRGFGRGYEDAVVVEGDLVPTQTNGDSCR